MNSDGDDEIEICYICKDDKYGYYFTCYICELTFCSDNGCMDEIRFQHSIYCENCVPDKVVKIIKEKELEFEQLIKMNERIEKNASKRKDFLIKKLSEAGLKLRGDSKLCKKYIYTQVGSKYDDIEYVVQRMSEMKFLYEYCGMRKELKKAEKRYCDEFNAGYIPDISIHDDAEHTILRRIGDYPLIFPWRK